MHRVFQLPFLTSLALCATFAPWAEATISRTTEPVGFMRYQIPAGLRTVGFPLMHAPIAAGRVTATDGNWLLATAGTEIATQLDPAAAYYLEFTAGLDGDLAFVGDRVEVDVAGTRDTTNSERRIRLQLGSAFSTLRTLPADLVGYRFVIRPHVTLSSVFGTGGSCALRAGEDTANADQAYLLQNGSYQSFLFQADRVTGAHRWVKFPEGNTADNLPIAPGAGLFVRRVATGGLTLCHVGDVRTHAFVQPLDAGHTLVSEPFPVQGSFETRGMTDANGFVAGGESEGADRVLVWNGEDYRTLYYAATAGATPNWRQADVISQSIANVNDAAFSPFHAVLVQKLVADRDYIVPSPF